ncbi:MAG: DUF6350 family protein [Cellulomonas sp.]|nr:DUF6350 family protein [Cellulomonas sp.]
MTSAERPRRSVLVEPEGAPGRTGLSEPPGRAVAAFAALQGWVLSVLLVVLPALAVALTAAEPGDQPGWGAGRAGLRLWLLGHWVPATVDGVGVSLVPLGITGLAVYTLYAATRRAQVVDGGVTGTVCYAGLTTAAALLSGVGGVGVVRSVVGGLVVGGLGTGLAVARGAQGWRAVAGPVSRRLSSPVAAGLRAAVLAGALIVALAGLLVAAWVVVGSGTVGEVVRGLSLDPVGGVVYAVAQLAYLPNFLVWAVAWLSGAGFVVGSGTRFAPDEVIGGPMPAVPLLGALPTWSGPACLALVAPAVLVLVGVVIGICLHRRAPVGAWWHQLAAVGTCALAVAVTTAVLVVAASGSAGPGRLSVVGAVWWQVGPLVGGLVGLGAALVALPGSAVLRHRARSAVGRRAQSAVSRATSAVGRVRRR